MKKSIKRLFAVLILVFIVLQMSIGVFALANIPEATSDFYVNDFANVFSQDEKERLMANAVNLSIEYSGIQIVVTTVESLEGNTIENYAVEMYNQYGIGKDDMGLLILLSTGDRQIRVEVGKAMEAYINDSKAGRFIDKYAIPSLKENKFNEGLINLQEAFIDEIVSNIESTTETRSISNTEKITSNAEQATTSKSISSEKIATGCLIFLFIIIIMCIISWIARMIKDNKEKEKTIEDLQQKLDESHVNYETEYTNNKNQSRELSNQIQNLTYEKDKISDSYKKLEDKCDFFDKQYQKLKDNYDSVKKQKDTLQSELNKLKSDYSSLEDWCRRIRILHPTADDEVTEMIEEEVKEQDMKLAEEADSIIQEVIELEPSKDIVEKLETAVSIYSNLNDRQKRYVKSDIKELKKLLAISLSLKKEYDNEMQRKSWMSEAEEAERIISYDISGMDVGRASNLTKLKNAKSVYNNLSAGATAYFSKSMLDKLNRLIEEAKRAQDAEEVAERRRREQERRRQEEEERKKREAAERKRREEEERRRKEEAERRRRREEEESRRRMQSSSHSSYGSSFHSGSSSHFGGFGGHSGGGGASRGF